MTILSDTLNRVYGSGTWAMGDQGITVNGQLKIPKARIKIWLAQQRSAMAHMPMVPIIRPRPLSIPKRPLDPSVFSTGDDAAVTPMPFLKKPTASEKKGKPEKTKALTCPKCNEIWEDCDCKHVWCPYCGYEPPSGTQRGLDMHVKAKHPEIDW